MNREILAYDVTIDHMFKGNNLTSVYVVSENFVSGLTCYLRINIIPKTETCSKLVKVVRKQPQKE